MRKEISITGTIRYYNENNQLHREDGPAIEYSNKDKIWYKNGQAHRLDGPTIEWHDGTNYWFIKGKQINVHSQEEFERYLKLIVFI